MPYSTTFEVWPTTQAPVTAHGADLFDGGRAGSSASVGDLLRECSRRGRPLLGGSSMTRSGQVAISPSVGDRPVRPRPDVRRYWVGRAFAPGPIPTAHVRVLLRYPGNRQRGHPRTQLGMARTGRTTRTHNMTRMVRVTITRSPRSTARPRLRVHSRSPSRRRCCWW
jgi:hypothetical protein